MAAASEGIEYGLASPVSPLGCSWSSRGNASNCFAMLLTPGEKRKLVRVSGLVRTEYLEQEGLLLTR